MAAGVRSDAEVVASVLGGRRDDYAALVERYQARLYRYALGMVHEPATAADLVQDTFVRAYTRLGSCHDPARFGAWLFSVLRNRCRDHLREHRRRDVPLDAEGRYEYRGAGPAEHAERAELVRLVGRALQALPQQQREAFLLKHVEDLSYEEMSELLGARIGALKMRVARAREGIRAALSGTGFGAPEEEGDAAAGQPSLRWTRWQHSAEATNDEA